ncbi:MAG: metal-dependent transcriptional regulator [Longimicrobiales bacterium]|nr:metal-dependent transcriptional regulator [Longimicrobiales bacterium]
MNPRSPHLSRSVEDYLKAIYALTEQGEAASTSQLAEALDVQPASVSGMIKRLAENGLVEHVPYRGVRLTEEGAREALRIVRRHRVLETYLHVRLGYSWDDVHREAERLEHAASDTLIDRMAAALEHPEHDPHGAPIPTRSGEIEETTFSTLNDAAVGDVVQIRAVSDEDSERLRYMEARGLLPGVRLRILGREPRDGPLTLRVGEPGGHEETVGKELARRIFVVGDLDRGSE